MFVASRQFAVIAMLNPDEPCRSRWSHVESIVNITTVHLLLLDTLVRVVLFNFLQH